ncbi:MAG: hypothetical protein IJ730_07850, partial [Alphaproteobacteria bacterium]|nr:hypothetical protein [Alphaproteobacteria bacterium]
SSLFFNVMILSSLYSFLRAFIINSASEYVSQTTYAGILFENKKQPLMYSIQTNSIKIIKHRLTTATENVLLAKKIGMEHAVTPMVILYLETFEILSINQKKIARYTHIKENIS